MGKGYTGKQIYAALLRHGFHEVRQKGSHKRLVKEITDQNGNVVQTWKVTLVASSDRLPPKTLSSILKQAGLTTTDLED